MYLHISATVKLKYLKLKVFANMVFNWLFLQNLYLFIYWYFCVFILNYLMAYGNYKVSAEISFSKLKLIKSRFRSTMGQDRLESLMLMSIECDI